MTRHPWLPNIAKFKAERFLKLIPPSFLCIASLSHDRQWIPMFRALEWPHQKVFIFFSISSHYEDGIVNILIKYAGIDWNIDFMRTSRLTLKRLLLF
jgi:hypothetical protein